MDHQTAVESVPEPVEQQRDRHLSEQAMSRMLRMFQQDEHELQQQISDYFNSYKQLQQQKILAARKALSEQPLDTAKKLDSFLQLAFKSDYEGLTAKEQCWLNVANKSSIKAIKARAAREKRDIDDKDSITIADILQGQATSGSDSRVKPEERQSVEYIKLKASFWTEFQEQNKKITSST